MDPSQEAVTGDWFQLQTGTDIDSYISLVVAVSKIATESDELFNAIFLFQKLNIALRIQHKS